MKKKKILSPEIKRILINTFNPIDTFRFYRNFFKQHKFLILVSAILALIPVGFMGFNLTPLVDAIGDNFIGDLDLIAVEMTGDTEKICSSIYGALVPIGQALAVLFWMVGISEIAMRDDLSPELIVKDLIKIIFTLIFIDEFGFDIAKGFIGFADYILGQVSTFATTSGSFAVQQADNFDNVPISKLPLSLLTLLAFLAFKFFIQIQVAIIMWARKLKVMLMTSLMPLGLYDFRDGFNSTSAMFLKKYFALCLQGVIIVVTTSIATQLLSAAFGAQFGIDGGLASLGKFLVTVIPVCLGMISMLKMSEQLACEVLGVH